MMPTTLATYAEITNFKLSSLSEKILELQPCVFFEYMVMITLLETVKYISYDLNFYNISKPFFSNLKNVSCLLITYIYLIYFYLNKF
jgi:hypothetical protein